jgi:hypothetical protein
VSLEQVDAQHGVMQQLTAWHIDTKHLGAASAFKEVSDKVFIKPLPQILTYSITFRTRVRVQLLLSVPGHTIDRLATDPHFTDDDDTEIRELPAVGPSLQILLG